MSSLNWLDTDDAQRRRMLEAIQLFTEHGTIDQIGLGTVRDAFSDLLFPGTSTLHTRLRYLLFVSWIFRSVAAEGITGDRAIETSARREYRLIKALLDGREQDGVIGRVAGRNLRRLPSLAYWAATSTFGLRQLENVSPEAYLRAAASLRAEAMIERALRYAESDTAPDHAGPLGWHSGLPDPPPRWLNQVTFELTAEEGEYLAERIATHVPGSMLAWLVTNGHPAEVDSIWQHPQRSAFPPELAEAVDHARRFAIASAGARCMYELQVARAQVADGQSEDLLDTTRGLLAEWSELMESERVFADWDLARFWKTAETERHLSPATHEFIDRWLSLAQELGGGVAVSDDAATLIADRERRLKGSLSRIHNSRPRENYRGPTSLVLLDYRWGVARRLLDDLYPSLGRVVAAETEEYSNAAT